MKTKSFSITKFTTKLLAVSALLLAGTNNAEALELNITYDQGTEDSVIRSFETAKEVYETLIKDPVTVNIHVQSADPQYFPDDTTLAMAIPAIEFNYEINNLVNGYKRDLQNENWGLEIDTRYQVAEEFCRDGQYGNEYFNGNGWNGCNNPNFYALGMLTDFSEQINDPDNPDPYLRERRAVTPFFHPNQNGDATTYKMLSTTAQLKAVESWHKLDSERNARLDGLIVINNLDGVNNPNTGAKLRWASWFGTTNTDNSEPFKNNHFNLVTVAMHEIGHVMGFFSGGDLINSGYEAKNATLRSDQVTFLDFFRRDSTTQINLAYGGDSSTSIYVGPINNGRLIGNLDEEKNFAISRLSRGIDTTLGGDGWQNSHFNQEITGLNQWYSLPTGRKNYLRASDDLMSPGLPTNWRRSISPQDAIVFDILGWNVDYEAYLSKSIQDYTRIGVRRANQIFETGERIVTDTQTKKSIEDQAIVLAATLVDAVVGEFPSFDENMDSLMSPEVQEGLNFGLSGQALANYIAGRGQGLGIRRLRSLSRASGIRQQFLSSGGNLPATLKQTLLLENPDGTRVEGFSLQQKGILFNKAIFADQGEFERHQEDNSNENIEKR